MEQGHAEERLVFIPSQGRVTFFDELAAQAKRPAERRPALGAEWLSVDPARALLPDLEREASTLFTGGDRHIDGCMLRCKWHLGAEKRVSWHPLLGFREE